MAVDRITAAKLSKRYGAHRALAGVDLELTAGHLCALLGPNGAGKSTLLGIVSTLVRPSGGEVIYREGSAAREHDDRLRGEIGVLAHAALIYGELTAVENLAFWGKLYGVADAEARAAALLDEVGLDDKARHRVARGYSRGMLQRLSLARALLHRPRVLLLDEPFTGLDRGGAQALARSLGHAKRDGCLVLVITHDLETISDLTDHVAVLQRGRLVHEERRPTGFAYDDLKALYHRYTE